MNDLPEVITLDLVEKLYAEQLPEIEHRGYVGLSGVASSCPVARLLAKHYDCRVSVSGANTYVDSQTYGPARYFPNDYGVRRLVNLVDDTTDREAKITPAMFTKLIEVVRGQLDNASETVVE